MTLPEAYLSQLEHIQESPKYQLDAEGKRVPATFPGYTIITPPQAEESKNQQFYQSVEACQGQLIEIFGQALMIPVPPQSLHLTLADLIWDNAYQEACKNDSFETQLQQTVGKSFAEFSANYPQAGMTWQIFGVLVMARAVGVCLVPKDKSTYESLVQFRRTVYQNSNLIALGIEQQYHFTAHVTLGYFGPIPEQLDRQRISDALSELNHQWIDSPQELIVHQAQLRKFDDMSDYYRGPDWPVVSFGNQS